MFLLLFCYVGRQIATERETEVDVIPSELMLMINYILQTLLDKKQWRH